ISRSIFDLYNYGEIRTPIFEVTDLFQRSIGGETDIVEKEMYTFTDKGNRQLTLRPEGTAPIVRAYLQNNIHKSHRKAKWYYVGPMFRYERPQAGRFRQFHQIGVENIGIDHPYSDAEIISMGIHLFDELGLSDLTVSINSVGCPVCRPVIQERLKQFLGLNLPHLCSDCQRRYDKNPLRILDCKNPKCETYFHGMPDIRKSLCRECTDHFNSVLEYIDALGIVFEINPRLVRGLDYYTKTTFEIISDTLGAQNAICGGGRYNKLIEEIGGPSTPAVGFAFGVERAVMILKQLADLEKLENNINIYLAPLGEVQRTKAFYILDELRRSGIKCEMDYVKDDLKAHLKHANKLRADFTLIYGEDEAEKNCMVVKNMKTGKQEEISLDTLVDHFSDE
ncbi:histidine--tRNA ligase, partial [Candidatus Margulisiibacteriota bacterium]